MKPLDMAIVVPSRRRVANMGTSRLLLPSAIVCVDEREHDDYAAVVPPPNLLLHPPMEGLPAVVNWTMDNIKQSILVLIDDDFQGVRVNTGSRRFITDSDEILAIIENGARACLDLELSCFCWSRTPNTTVIRPDVRPIVPTQLIGSAFGVMGAARKRHYDARFSGRSAVDWTLRTLHQDRAVLADIRYFFDCGVIFSGRGGNVGVVTPEAFTNASRALVRKWGNALSLKAPGYVKNRQQAALRIAVSRTNKIAQK
jgi:hypothetical protein